MRLSRTLVSRIMSDLDTSASPGRDSNGRFTKDNPGGPGNPHARQVAELRKRLLDKVTPDEMDAIIDALLKRAREGDVSAAKLILQYTLGKPLEATNPDRLDADEADAFFSNALSAQTQQLAQVQPLDLMLPLFRIAIATRGKDVLHQFTEQFVERFGADGQEPEREAARPRAAEDTVTERTETDQPPTAPPPATVTERMETVPAISEKRLRDQLTAILTAPADRVLPTDGKRDLPDIDAPTGLPPLETEPSRSLHTPSP